MICSDLSCINVKATVFQIVVPIKAELKDDSTKIDCTCFEVEGKIV